jgi:hypothetical protein
MKKKGTECKKTASAKGACAVFLCLAMALFAWAAPVYAGSGAQEKGAKPSSGKESASPGKESGGEGSEPEKEEECGDGGEGGEGNGSAPSESGSCAASVTCKPSAGGGYIQVAANGGNTSRNPYYEVSRRSSGGKWAVVHTGNAGGAGYSYKDSGCSPNTSYRYRVRGYYMASGSRRYSGYVSSMDVAVNANKAPQACSSLKASRKDADSVKLSWGGGGSCSGYEVYCRKGASGSYKSVGTCSSSYTSRSVNGLKGGASYTFVVRSYIESGGKKVYSENSKAASCQL